MDELLALARAEQERAKVMMRRRLVAHTATLALTIIALFVDQPGTYVLAAIALLSEAAAWGLRWHAGELHDRSERGRRRALIGASLGRDPDPTGTASLKTCFSSHARRDATRWHDADYWFSNLPPGPKRLRDTLQESAFWSCRLYRAAARRALWRLLFFGGGAAFAVLVLAVGDSGALAETAARVLTVVLACIITTDELGIVLSYHSAGGEAERTVGALDRADLAELATALALYGDYATATATAAPIPTSVYTREHDAVATAWAQRHPIVS